MKYYANPYDISHRGFYFETMEEYQEKLAAHPAEEFEIEFIDGSSLQAYAFRQAFVNMGNIHVWLEECEPLDDNDLLKLCFVCDQYPTRKLAEQIEYLDNVFILGTIDEYADILYDQYRDEGTSEHLLWYVDFKHMAKDQLINSDYVVLRINSDSPWIYASVE